MIINMTTFAGRKEHYIGQTLESLFQSDGRDIPLNLILGSSDTSHVEQYRNRANIVLWDRETEARAQKGRARYRRSVDRLRHNCTVNAIRALKYGDDDYCLCCEDDIIFDVRWFSQLMLVIEQIGNESYVLNLGQDDDQLLELRYITHTQPYLCGAQGIFYSHKRLRIAVAEYVERNARKGMNDELIGVYAKRYAALYNACPALVRHIGEISSFHTSDLP